MMALAHELVRLCDKMCSPFKQTDVSEEHMPSILRVEEPAKQENQHTARGKRSKLREEKRRIISKSACDLRSARFYLDVEPHSLARDQMLNFINLNTW
jgi:hypothetical protein